MTSAFRQESRREENRVGEEKGSHAQMQDRMRYSPEQCMCVHVCGVCMCVVCVCGVCMCVWCACVCVVCMCVNLLHFCYNYTTCTLN